MGALYQRRKGRDLFDLWYALEQKEIDIERLIQAYRKFMEYLPQPPTKKMYLGNINEKMKNEEFLSDMSILLKPGVDFNIQKAWKRVKEGILERL